MITWDEALLIFSGLLLYKALLLWIGRRDVMQCEEELNRVQDQQGRDHV